MAAAARHSATTHSPAVRAASALSSGAQRFADPHACRWPLAAQFCMIMPKAAGNLSGAIEGKGLTGKMKVENAAP